MLQTYTATQPGHYEERTQALNPGYFIDIAKRRVFYFAVPFVLILITGFVVVGIQRPIFESEAKILVESPQIPTDLVEPTVTAAATERIQVIQQRLMSRDSLLPIVQKFNLFPSERTWMSETQLLDLMRERAVIALVDVNAQVAGTNSNGQPSTVPQILRNAKDSAVAFTLTFDYEAPDVAMKVANELLTAVLDEDVRSRTTNAAETTEFLTAEVKQLQTKLDGIDGQIFTVKQQAVANLKQGTPSTPDDLKLQNEQLVAMKTDLIQKSSVYSDEHPAVKALKKRIAALEEQIAQATKSSNSASSAAPDQDIDALLQQRISVGKELDDESRKLAAARLGETMERNQQSEHLQVIEQPGIPQKPIKPNRPKLFGISLALAMMGGAGTVVLAEMLDRTIRGSNELARVVDRRLLVSIPYIVTAEEAAQRRRKIVWLWGSLTAFLLVGILAALYIGVVVDFSWFDRSWIDALTRLSK